MNSGDWVENQDYVINDSYIYENEKVNAKVNVICILSDKPLDEYILDIIAQYKYIKFGHNYNTPIINLPLSITHISIGDGYNQILYNLSDSITHINIGNSYNQKFKSFPNGLTHLKLGDAYDQDIGDLPNTITHLILGRGYYKDITKLPQMLQYLTINCDDVQLAIEIKHNIDSEKSQLGKYSNLQDIKINDFVTEYFPSKLDCKSFTNIWDNKFKLLVAVLGTGISIMGALILKRYRQN